MMVSRREEEARTALSLFDSDGRGVASYRGAKLALRALGIHMKKGEIMEQVDSMRERAAATEREKEKAKAKEKEKEGGEARGVEEGSGYPAEPPSKSDPRHAPPVADGITADEFVQLALDNDSRRDENADFRKAFELFSQSPASELITAGDIQRIAVEHGMPDLSLEYAQELINELDLDGKGGLSRMDFTKLMTLYLKDDIGYES